MRQVINLEDLTLEQQAVYQEMIAESQAEIAQREAAGTIGDIAEPLTERDKAILRRARQQIPGGDPLS